MWDDALGIQVKYALDKNVTLTHGMVAEVVNHYRFWGKGTYEHYVNSLTKSALNSAYNLIKMAYEEVAGI
jgi:hypothetical protein